MEIVSLKNGRKMISTTNKNITNKHFESAKQPL